MISGRGSEGDMEHQVCLVFLESLVFQVGQDYQVRLVNPAFLESVETLATLEVEDQ